MFGLGRFLNPSSIINIVGREARYQFFGDKQVHPEDEEDVTGKVVVITGAQRGIGKADAMELAKRNAIVVMGCVDMDVALKAVQEIKDKTGNQNVEAIHLDLSDMDNVEAFALSVAGKYPKIKILINNAGIGDAHGAWAKQKTREGFQIHVAVNHLGHFLLTNLLLENLKREESARVVSMSSSVQLFAKLDLDDLMMDKSGFGLFDSLPYHNTKFANALFIKELAERLKGSNVTAYALCPSMVSTQIYDRDLGLKFVSKNFGFTPEQASSQFVMFCALNKGIANESGLMYSFNRHLKVANKRLTPDLSFKLWNLSAQLVSLDERLQRLLL